MKNLPKRISSAAMQLVTEDGRVLIVKAHYKSHWSLPSGIVDPGETPLEAAVREAEEEVGLTIKTQDVEFVRVSNRASSSASTYQFVFASNLSEDMIQCIELQPEEISEWALVDRDEVKSANREYGKVILDWADGKKGYVEHTFGRR